MFQNVASKTSRPPSNLEFMKGFLDMQKKKMFPKVRFCGAGSDNFFIVDPLGDIYGSYEEAGTATGASERFQTEKYTSMH